MNNNDRRCSQCGSKMTLHGGEGKVVIYRCNCCGKDDYVEASATNNADYLHKRSLLLGRVRKGIIDWEVTQWNALRREILDFSVAFDAARCDIGLKIAIIACLTNGFHDLDNKRYKECKRIFKVTEKMYKRYSKKVDIESNGMNHIGEYEEYRCMYKACKYEYLGCKTAYKLLFKLGGKLIPIPKL